jgi:hypothetical protein
LILLEVTVTASDEDETPIKKGYTVIKIETIAIDEIRLDRTSHSLRAGASVTLRQSQFSKDNAAASPRRVTWHVVREPGEGETATIFIENESTGQTRGFIGFAPYDPRDPFADGGPIAIVNSEGRVTALRDGRCWVYAEVTVGDKTIRSNPCRIDIAKQAATGVAVNRRRHTMSTGTTMTLSATVRPAAASNKGITWAAFDMDGNPAEAIKFVNTGHNPVIFTAEAAGVYRIVATHAESTNLKAECILTVTDGPSSTVRMGRRANFAVLGAAARDTVNWTLVNHKDVDGKDAFGIEESGVRRRLTANNVGSATLTGSMIFNLEEPIQDPDHPDDPTKTISSIVVREQSWNIAAVVPITRMGFKNGEESIRNLTLGVRRDENSPTGFSAVDSDGNPITTTLSVEILRPESGATVLGFDWSVRVNKKNPQPFVGFVNGDEVVSDLPVVAPAAGSNSTITIQALRPGSTRITGTNHNGRRRATLTVRVFLYPEPEDIKLRASTFSLEVGRVANVKARVNGKGLHRGPMEYSLSEGAEQFVTLDAVRARLTAIAETPEGVTIENTTVKLIIKAPGGRIKEVPIIVRPRR